MKQERFPLRETGIAILVFLVVFMVYFSQRDLVTTSDSRWTLHLAASMLRTHNIDLDEYEDVIDTDDYKVFEYNEHFYSKYPLGTSLLILPFMPALDVIPKPFHTTYQQRHKWNY